MPRSIHKQIVHDAESGVPVAVQVAYEDGLEIERLLDLHTETTWTSIGFGLLALWMVEPSRSMACPSAAVRDGTVRDGRLTGSAAARTIEMPRRPRRIEAKG